MVPTLVSRKKVQPFILTGAVTIAKTAVCVWTPLLHSPVSLLGPLHVSLLIQVGYVSLRAVPNRRSKVKYKEP